MLGRKQQPQPYNLAEDKLENLSSNREIKLNILRPIHFLKKQSQNKVLLIKVTG